MRFTAEEKAQIEQRMEEADIRNMSEYLLKMALNGYILRLDLPEIRRMVFLLANATNNLNQLAKRANETRSVHIPDINDLKRQYEGLWRQSNDILKKLAKL